jgi:hypothetical protein
MEAARQLGVDYQVALRPDKDNPESFGTINVDQAGTVTSSGGSLRRIAGEPAIRARTQRYHELMVSIRELSSNKEVLSNRSALEQEIASLQAARDALGDALGFPRPGNPNPNGLVQLAIAGVAQDNARTQSALKNQPAVDTAKAKVMREHPGEEPLKQEGFRTLIAFLVVHEAQFPNLLKNLRHLRTTGEVTNELVEDMVDLFQSRRVLFSNARNSRPTCAQALERHRRRLAKAARVLASRRPTIVTAAQ